MKKKSISIHIQAKLLTGSGKFMKRKHNNRAFSLTEVLMAIAVLSVGMVFIGGVFPVAIHFTTIAAERTTAAVVADEAFAKIQLYAIGNPNDISDDVDVSLLSYDDQTDFNDHSGPYPFPATQYIRPDDFAYPSDFDIDFKRKQYSWSALCQRIGDRDVKVTVFISRRTNSNSKFYYRDAANFIQSDGLLPQPVDVQFTARNLNELTIVASGSMPSPGELVFFPDGCTILDNYTGQTYRVIERDRDYPDRLILDRNWQGGSPLTPGQGYVWVVPPSVNSSRNPCVGVFQKNLRF